MITHSSNAGGPPAEDFSPPLLSDETLAALERHALAARWPEKQLMTLTLRLCKVERAECAALVERATLRVDLAAGREHVADVLLSALGNAIEHKQEETADLLARVFATPAVRAALVPALEAVLKPTVLWLRGGFGDMADRVADLEHDVTGSGVSRHG